MRAQLLTSYHSNPAAPHDPYDDNDNDSDLDLDLNELDPATSAAPTLSRGQSSAGRQSHEYGGQIPLRTLRFGGRRRPRAEDEDMEALLDTDDAARKREGGGVGGDDAPMMNGTSRRFRIRTSMSFPSPVNGEEYGNTFHLPASEAPQ